MKKIKIILIGAILFGTLLPGCNDFLDVKPKSVWESTSFYSNRQEAEIALAGIYNVLAADNCFGQTVLILEAGTDEAYHNRRGSNSWEWSRYLNTPAYTNAADFWTSLYTAINLSNLFIESLNASSMEQQEYDEFLGEVRFLRGWSYFLLTNYWGEVPLRLKSSKNQDDNHLAASPLKDIYEAIISDLNFAAENLPHPMDAIPGRAHNLAAHGMLARLYLKMSGYPYNEVATQDYYQEALDHCLTIINDGYHSLEVDGNGYEKVFRNLIGSVYNTNEVLFEISYQNLRDQGLFVNGRYGNLNGLNFGTTNTLGDPNGFNMYGVAPTLANLYDKDNDMRYKWNVPGVSRNGNDGNIRRVSNELVVLQFCPGKYRRWTYDNEADLDIDGVNEPYTVIENARSELNRNFTSINAPVIRYSDILLMAAEATNEISGPNAAVGYLNQVRTRAGLDLL